MLRLKLTDGVVSFYCIEYDAIPELRLCLGLEVICRLDIPPGTKVMLTNPEFYNGRCLLHAGSIKVLGGVVSSLVELWKAQETLAMKNRFRSNVRKNGGNPPQFISFEDFVKKKHRMPQIRSEANTSASSTAGVLPAMNKVEDLDLSEIQNRRKEALGDINKLEVKDMGKWGSSKQIEKTTNETPRREKIRSEPRREVRRTKTMGDAGLSVGTVSEAYSSTVGKGYVIDQTASPGSSVEAGTSVGFTVSLGPEPQQEDPSSGGDTDTGTGTDTDTGETTE